MGETKSEVRPKIWTCKIGEVHPEMVPPGGDSPMRLAVAEAYFALTGQRPAFIFSGWGGELDESERAVVENRLPSEAHERDWRIRQAAPDLLEALRKIGCRASKVYLSGNVCADAPEREPCFVCAALAKAQP